MAVSSQVVLILDHIFAIYSLILVIFGTAGNMICFVVCVRKPLRKVPTFVIMAFLSVIDTISLYFWNLNAFYQMYFNFILQEVNYNWCRVVYICQFFSLEASAFLLVAMSIERYLSVKFIMWRKKYFNSNRAIIACAVILTIFFSINIPLANLLTDNINSNGTYIGNCLTTTVFAGWRNKHTYLSSFIPFGIILVVNILLIYEMIKFERKKIRGDKRSEGRKTTSISVIVLTFFFILFTGPIAFLGFYFRQYLFSQNGHVVLWLLNASVFTYHASNFLFFMASNRKFSAEFKRFIKCKPSASNNSVS